jgi:hypothetical protein
MRSVSNLASSFLILQRIFVNNKKKLDKNKKASYFYNLKKRHYYPLYI